MVTDGGSISGYCVTGSCIKAINPRKTKRTEITIDNTGRLMKDDNMFLELADECMADFIITGNTNDFTFSAYKQTKIVNPKEYWENHAPK
jgi:predicted nucleic acid-binding protein